MFPSFSHVWSVLRALSPEPLRAPNAYHEYTDILFTGYGSEASPDKGFTNSFATHTKYHKWMESVCDRTEALEELKLVRIWLVKRKLGFLGTTYPSETEYDRTFAFDYSTSKNYPQPNLNTVVELPDSTSDNVFYDQDQGARRLENFIYCVKANKQLRRKSGRGDIDAAAFEFSWIIYPDTQKRIAAQKPLDITGGKMSIIIVAHNTPLTLCTTIVLCATDVSSKARLHWWAPNIVQSEL
ncbi:hypothetical protein M422DRAFT_782345 [Sphaerobolus stellatus SS14]|uniref:Uncharacterized protein n=1 Tax=Sphaerobolus stellatus (strain SS14) TaxID=990650 RepID=A0A0C9V370_SPHS4|nr:hypothetical protein M422DRAFT_782345 [Sphaerobolus stellatus SS14]